MGQTEELLRSLIQHTADIVAVLEPDGSIRYLSPAVERVLGYRPEELVGKDIFGLVHPDDVGVAQRFYAGHPESPGISPQLRLRRKDGSWCDVEATVNNLLEDPAVRGIVTISRDISERKRAEAQVRFQARLLDAVGQAVIATDTRGNVTYWGRYAEEMYGWPAREMVGRSADEILVSGNQRDHAEEIMAELRAGRSWSGEFLVSRKDRTTFPALVTNSPVYDDRGNLVGIIGVSTSIGEIKEAEQALRQSEKKFRMQYQGFPIPTYSWKRSRGDFVLIDFNEAARETTRGGISGFLGRKASDMYPERPDILERFSRCFHGRTTIKEETRWRSGTAGEQRDLVVSYVFVPPDLVMVHTEDVTERKRAEAALRESEEWFRELHNATFEGIFIHDGERILVANEALAAMSGYEVEELVGSPGLSFVTPESRPVVARHIMAGSGEPYEVVGIRKDGTLLDLEVRGREFVYRDLPARMVSVRDITERKRAEERLRVLADASRAFTEAGTEYQPLLDVVARSVAEDFGDLCGVWLLSEDGRMLDPVALHHPDPGTASVIRLLRGLSIPFGEGITGTVVRTGEPLVIPVVDPERFAASVYPEHRPHVGRLGVRSVLVVPLRARGEVLGCLVLARIRQGEPYTQDDRRLAEDLAERAALAIDNALLYRAAGREIAERARAEKALEASERRLGLIYHNTTDELFLLAVEPDGVYRFVSANDTFLSVSGLTREQVLGRRMEEVMPPASHELVRSRYREALRENRTVRWEEVSEYPAGLRYGEVTVTPMRDESTSQSYLVGSIHDITGLREEEAARRRAEERHAAGLRESEERFRTLTDAALEALVISERADGEGRILGVNQAFTEVFGYEPGEFAGRGYRDIIAPESWDLVERNISSGYRGIYEAAGRSKDGTRLDLEIRGKTATFRGRRVRISALRDITERKRAEARLRVLAGASQAFARNVTEYQDLVQTIARIVAEDFGDLCSVWLLSEDRQTVEPAAYHHPNPEFVSRAAEVMGRPVRVGAGFAGRVAQTGEPIFMPVVVPEELHAMVEPESRPLLPSLDIRSILAVPLRARGVVIGCLGLARVGGAGDPYTENDRRFAEDLAERAALAIDGALSYRTAQREISERESAEEKLRESEEWFRALAYNAYDLTVVQDAGGVVAYVNPAAERVLGYRPGELVGQRFLDYVHPDDREETEKLFAEIRSQSGVHEPFEFRLPHKDGSWRYLECAANNMLDDPTVRGVVINQRDITERKQMEERLEYQAFHDLLTGLPNRALFLDRVEQAISRAQRSGGRLAVLFLDLDGFKTVNDSLGHEAGDQLLRDAAERLRMRLRPKDTIARLGGDEFVVLLEDVPEPGDLVRVIDRLMEDIRAPFALLEREVFVTVSIGISLSVSGQGLPEDLIRQADTAMYGAKQRAGNSYQVFDPGMHTRILRRLEVESELRRAVERGEFVLHYQPIVDLGSGRVAGVEALVRWEHPERGLIQPDKFIPIAEETGLIVPLGRWVVGEACRQAREWRSERDDLSALLVSVNLSLKQLRQNDLGEEVARALREAGLDPSALSLEITESVAIDEDESAVPTLRELKELGVRLAMDDFGAGHSSLTYLIKHLRMDTLKIDRAFTGELVHDPEHGVVLSGIVGFARALGLRVVAEGIESAEQLELVRELGCDLGQGFFLARPVPSEEMPALLSRTFLA